jgi:hypothetical protein
MNPCDQYLPPYSRPRWSRSPRNRKPHRAASTTAKEFRRRTPTTSASPSSARWPAAMAGVAQARTWTARTPRQQPETPMPKWPWRGIRITATATGAGTIGRGTAGRRGTAGQDMAIGIGPPPPPGTGMAKPQPWRSASCHAARGCARASISRIEVLAIAAVRCSRASSGRAVTTSWRHGPRHAASPRLARTSI